MRGSGRWGRRIAAAGSAFALASGLYLGNLGHGFHYDDFHSIVRNPHIRSLSQVPSFFVDPRLFSVNPESAMYRPVLLASYALNYALDGDRPAGYHLANLLLHGAVCALAVVLLQRLGLTTELALAAALLFAAHPANSEAVHYVSSRSELLMAFLFLCACTAHLRFGTTRGLGWYAAALLAGALALATKSVAAALAPAAALCDGVVGGWSRVRRNWWPYLGYAALALGYVAWTGPLVGRALLAPVRPLAAQVWTQCKAAVYYAMLAGVPVHLSVEPQFRAARSFAESAVVAAVALVGSAAWLLTRGGPRTPRFGAAWFGLLLLPTAVVPLIVLVNEHRLYLAGVGSCLAMAWALCGLGRTRPGVARLLTAGYTLLLAVLVLQRSPAWTSELTLWQDAAAKGPEMLKPHLRLADALAAAGRIDEAEEQYRLAIRLRPEHPAARNNLGLLELRQQRLPAAEEQFRAVLMASPDNLPARLNLGKALVAQGRWPEAAAECRAALEYGTTDGEAQRLLGHIALNLKGDPAEALAWYDQALRWSPDRAALQVARGVALRRLQRAGEAEAAYLEALRLDPTQVEAWLNLGNLYRDSGRAGDARAAYARVLGADGAPELTAAAARALAELAP